MGLQTKCDWCGLVEDLKNADVSRFADIVCAFQTNEPIRCSHCEEAWHEMQHAIKQDKDKAYKEIVQKHIDKYLSGGLS